MKVIRKVSDDIEKQIELAQCYGKAAMELKEDRPALAETYAKAAAEMLDIMNSFHTQVVNIITEYRKTNGEVPKDMQMLYDILHEKHISDTITAKSVIALYNGGR